MVIIGDENIPRFRPYVTYGLIATNLLCWLVIQQMGFYPGFQSSLCNYGLIGGDLLGTIDPVRLNLTGFICPVDGVMNPHTLISHMFMHGSWIHILLNMLMLWVLGDNIEATLGRIRYLIFYFVSGLVAAAFQIASDPATYVPMVGASGAISGVIGAYLILYPRNRLTFFLIIFPITARAWVILGGWFLIQILMVVGGTHPEIALWAHIGGFVCGLLLITLLKKRIPVRTSRFPPS